MNNLSSIVIISNIPLDSNIEELGGIFKRCGMYKQLVFASPDSAICEYKDNASAKYAIKNCLIKYYLFIFLQ
jgi:hypothetical protein